MKENTIIRNPLTVISIFAGLAEVAGTGVLPFVSQANQNTYIWFLMIFPVLLVVLFFLTLNFNPTVLYAPSDFRDEKNFMDLFRSPSAVEQLEKFEEEIREAVIEEDSDQEVADSKKVRRNKNKTTTLLEQNSLLPQFLKLESDPYRKYILAENLIIERLSQELQLPARRDVALKNSRFIFDAVFEGKHGPIFVEVKYLKSKSSHLNIIKRTLDRLQNSLASMPKIIRQNAKLILAIAHELSSEEIQQIKTKIDGFLKNFIIPVEVKFYTLDDLVLEETKRS